MTNMDMSEAIGMLAQEKGLSEEALLHVLVDALASAYKRRDDAADEVVVEVNPETLEFSFIAYDVDEDGNWVNERDDTPRKEEMGRIAAMTFRQVMSQRIREVESDRKFEEYANREGDIVTGIIQRTDARYTLLDLGRAEALLPQAEQVPFERPAQGDRQKAYIVEVRRTPKGPQIVVSRTHPGLIKRLFELEVPEIADGIVEIKACAREPGHRTKIAVWSNDHNVDPVGACVGARGGRVRMVVNEMRGEKIDIVPFSEDLADFVAKALSPAKVTQVIISEDGTAADVIVPDHQLSLAIGREGQNARLSARLTGVRVDIRSETQLAEGIPAGHGRDSDVEYAVGEWRPNAETGENEWHAADGSVISESEWNKKAEEAQAEAEAAAAADAEIPEVLEELKAGPWAGSVMPMSDPDQVPPGFEIKGNEQSEVYHVPGSSYYDATKAELWFRSVDAAEGAGYTPPGGGDDTSESDIDASAESAEAPADTDQVPAEVAEAPADDAAAPAEATEVADGEATSEEDD
jgi:N utilization substance protein A